MVTAVWSMKGGVGVSSVTCMLAMGQVERASPTVILDLDGDVPAVLGMADSDAPGLADWFATPSRSPGALARITHDVVPDLQVIRRGAGDLRGEPAALLRALPDQASTAIVDCGMLANSLATGVAQAAEQRLLVARPCYLTLRALRTTPVEPTGVVMLDERGRALGRVDIESVVGAPVVATIALDPAIARALDAGLVTTRLPRSLVRALGSVISP